MKRRLWWAGILATGLIVAIGICSLPAVQRRIILAVGNSLPGTRLSIGRIHIGLKEVNASDVQLTRARATARASGIHAEYSLWTLVTQFKLVIPRLAVSGVEADIREINISGAETGIAGLSRERAVTEQAPRFEFHGMFDGARLPVDLELRECSIAGKIILPGALGPDFAEARFDISGGGMRSGSRGNFPFFASIAGPAPDGLEDWLRAEGKLGVTISPAGQVSGADARVEIRTAGAYSRPGQMVQIDALLERTDTGESYGIQIGAGADRTFIRIAELDMEFDAAKCALNGSWLTNIPRGQIEHFIRRMDNPEFFMNGNGRFAVDVARRSVTFQTAFNFGGAMWGKIHPKLAGIGPFSAIGRIDGICDSVAANIGRLAFLLNDDAGRTMLTFQTRDQFDFRIPTRSFAFSGRTGEVAEIQMSGLPVAWAAGFAPDAGLAGGRIYGSAILSAEGYETFSIQCRNPVQVRDLGIRSARIDELRAEPHVQVYPDGIVADVGNLSVSFQNGDAISGRARIAAPPKADPPVLLTAEGTANLANLLNKFGRPGPVSALAELGMSFQPGAIRVHSLKFRSNGPGGLAIATIQGIQPFDLSLKDGTITPSDTSPEIARVVLGPARLRVAIPVFGGFGGEAELIRGNFTISSNGKSILLATAGRLEIIGGSMKKGNSLLLDNVSIGMSPRIEYWPGARLVCSNTGSAESRGDALYSITANADVSSLLDTPTGAVSIRFNGFMPPLLRQPIAAGLNPLNSGALRADIDIRLGAKKTVNIAVTADSMTGKNGRRIPSVSFELRLDRNADRSILLYAPLVVRAAARKTEIRLEATAKPVGYHMDVDARLGSDAIHLDDVLAAYTGLFPAPASVAAPKPRADTKPVAGMIAQYALRRDSAPLWDGILGTAGIDIKTISYGGRSLDNVRGSLKFGDTDLRAEGLNADFLGAKTTGQVRIAYSFARPKPYSIDAMAAVDRVDMGRMFRDVYPDREPTLEGIFNVKTKIYGDGANMFALQRDIYGNIHVSGERGKFRGLKSELKLASAGAGILGAITFSKELKAVSRLSEKLSIFSFSSFEAGMDLDKNYDFTLRPFSLISDEIRLTGSGSIPLVKDRPVIARPLDITIQLSGRGEMTTILESLKLAARDKDDMGFTRMNSAFAVKGTVGRPDASGLYAIFDEAAKNASGIFGIIMRFAKDKLGKFGKSAGVFAE